MATSAPDPMAIPRSACASAGASLMPSPTMATRRPPACSLRISSTFGLRQRLRHHVLDAGLAGDGFGHLAPVAGEQPHFQAQRAQAAHRLGGFRFDGVGHFDRARRRAAFGFSGDSRRGVW